VSFAGSSLLADMASCVFMSGAMRTLQQILNVLMMVLFLFAAVLQYNDDDDVLRWTAIYLIAAGCCVCAAVGKLKWWLPILVAAVCAAWAAVYVARGLWSMPLSEAFAEWETKSPRVIQVRDMFGLLVIAVWMVLLAMTGRPRTQGLD
jgi:hypothetical protein